MSDFFSEAVFLGVFITLGAYFLGVSIKKKWKLAIFNPLLLAIVFTMIFLLISRMPYDVYNEGAKYISYLLTPATVSLAIPLYEQFEALRKNVRAIMVGIVTGVLTSMASVLALAVIFRFDHKEYVTFLPKSITTAIGMGVSEELDGYVAITVAVIIVTGIIGNMIAEMVCRLFHITEPVAKGIAIGSASHAVGTTKAMEMGEIEGAMSSLSIVLSGLLTVFGAMIFANLR
ncbi:MAG: LrgB family protein [Lachnospiraceae bacterium]|nr:LrgB family protein [Lachnospiraceae bacterium]MDD7177647.1 LrgB family protein [bacterium]MDY5516620.1 LrgB family protein [Lachnospiraceae bacterium]